MSASLDLVALSTVGVVALAIGVFLGYNSMVEFYRECDSLTGTLFGGLAVTYFAFGAVCLAGAVL